MKTIGARLANGNRGKGQPDIDAEAIRELAELLGETGLTEIEIERNGARIRVSRQAAAPVAAPVAAAAPAPPQHRQQTRRLRTKVRTRALCPRRWSVRSLLRPSRASRPS